jgi:transketolase
MRMGRADFPTILESDVEFEIGKATVLKEGTDVTIVGCGQMVSSCLEAAEMLGKEGIDAEVINMSTIKPIDRDTLIESVEKTGCCVTAEEHSIIGGLGSAVAEALCDTVCVPLERVGTKDTFGESGKPEDLMGKYRLTASDICDAASRSISRKG